jgi:hypothetical protein
MNFLSQDLVNGGGAESPLLAFDLTFLVFIVIIAASALFNWLKRKNEMQDEWEDPSRPGHPPQHRPQTPGAPHERPPKSWEEELRRLLEGDRPQAPPPEQRQPSPPPYQAPAPPPVYSPLRPSRPAASTKPPPVIVREVGPPPPRAFDVSPPPVKRPKVVARTVSTHAGAVMPAAPLPPSNLAYQLRSHQGPTGYDRTRRSPEVEQVLRIFRNPSTARQAVIASIILNPPKALEL